MIHAFVLGIIAGFVIILSVVMAFYKEQAGWFFGAIFGIVVVFILGLSHDLGAKSQTTIIKNENYSIVRKYRPPFVLFHVYFPESENLTVEKD